MNHRSAEVTEKKKKRRPSRWRILLAFMLLFALLISGTVSMLFFNRHQNVQAYERNRSYWNEYNLDGEFLIVVDELGTPNPPISSERLWARASHCIEYFTCHIDYNDHYHYPEYIKFSRSLWIRVIDFQPQIND